LPAPAGQFVIEPPGHLHTSNPSAIYDVHVSSAATNLRNLFIMGGARLSGANAGAARRFT
jgi:hypothetical protein